MLLSAIEILINEKNDRRNPFYAKQLVGRENMASPAVWRKFGPWQTNHGQSWSDSEQKYNFSFLILKINICIVNKDVNRNQTCFYWVKKIINGRYRIYLGLRKNACLSTVMTIFHLCRIITTRVTRLHQPMMRAYKVILKPF